MAIYKSNNRLLGGKLEAVNGEAETLTSADFDVRVNSVDIGLDVSYTDVKALDGTMTQSLQIPGIVKGTMDFDFNLSRIEYLATGTAGSAVFTAKAPFAKYFKSAGMTAEYTEPTDEDTNDGYVLLSPSSDACDTITESLFDVASGCGGLSEGIEYKEKGIINAFTIDSTEVGAPLVANFTGQGGVEGVEDVIHANIPVFDDDNTTSTRSAIMLNTDILLTKVNLDGTAIAGEVAINVCSDVFTLDSGIEQGEITCQQDAYGISQYFISAKKPTLSITPMLTSISDFDWWGSMTVETVYAISIVNYVDGTKTDKAVQIDIPRAQLTTASGEDSNGSRRLSETFSLLKNTQGVTVIEKEADYTIKVFGKTINETV